MSLKLEQSQSLLESILKSVGSGIIVADETGKFLLYNPAAEKLFGIGATVSSPAEWSKLYGFFAEDGITPLPEDELPLVRAIRGQSVSGMRVYIKNAGLKDGLWLSMNARPLVTADGAIAGGVISFEDITRQKELEQEAARSNADLEQFASVAAHDLQEPLRTVVSFLNLLEQRTKNQLDEKSARYVHNAVSGAKRMQVLINDLLAYSRIRTKGQPFALVNMQLVIQDVLDDLGGNIAESAAKIDIGRLPNVRGDRSQLRHLCLNLINNAIKFRKQDEPLRIEVGVTESRKTPHLVTFYFRDNGIGIEPEFYERIFVIFRRLHGMDEYPGTGIGLAICQRIVERHGGRIWVESALGVGSTFYLTLPLEQT